MKRLLPFLLPLLVACNRDDAAEDAQNAAIEDALLANLEAASTTDDPGRARELVNRAMPAALPAGSEPQYQNIRAGVGGAACGEVSTMGAGKKRTPFRPFVVTPEAIAIIGTEPKIKFNDASDFIADAWIRWCATPEELAQVEGQISSSPTLEENPLNTSDIPDLSEADLLPVAPKQPMGPERRTSLEPPPPPPPAQIDSFSKSISRPQS